MPDAREFVSAMKQAGFSNVRKLSGEYDALGTFAMVEDNKGMRFDVFDRQVCKALEMSQGMRSHARFYRSFGNLDVHLMSPEDIFLFKGITEREADLDDMRILAESRVDWKAIEKECLSQKSGHWAYMLGTKLLELRAKFAIDSPIIKALMERADLELLAYVFGQIILERRATFREIGDRIKERYGYSESWTRKQLVILQRKKIVGVEEKGRSQLYYMRRTPSFL